MGLCGLGTVPGASVRGAFGGIWQMGLGHRAHFNISNSPFELYGPLRNWLMLA